jgi:hypothetical protein
VTVDGRDAVKVSCRRFIFSLISEDSVTFYRATGRILAKQQSDPGRTYDLVLTGTHVVTAIPCLSSTTSAQGDGRVYD